MEFKNLVEEVKELYDLLLITDKHFKNSKLHGKQLKSIFDIIQIKQNDVINYVLEKNGKPPKKIKIMRGGYNKKILKEEPETEKDDELSSLGYEFNNIEVIDSLLYNEKYGYFYYKNKPTQELTNMIWIQEKKLTNEIYSRIKKNMDISPDYFLMKLKICLEESPKGFMDLLMSMKNMNDKDFIDCFKDEFDDEEYKNKILLLIEDNHQSNINKKYDEDDEDDELLSLKSVVSSDDLNEVINEY